MESNCFFCLPEMDIAAGFLSSVSESCCIWRFRLEGGLS
jgi:hypothetical protein